MKTKHLFITLISILLLCSCSSNKSALAFERESNSMTNTEENSYAIEMRQVNITHKKFYKINTGNDRYVETKKISIQNEPFYFFYKNVCTFWEKNLDDNSSKSYKVLFSYYCVFDDIVFKGTTNNVEFLAETYLSDVSDLTEKCIDDFYNEHPFNGGIFFNYIFECNDEILICMLNDSFQIWATIDAACELGVTFID